MSSDLMERLRIPMGWKSINPDPTSPAVRAFIRSSLAKLYQGRIFDLDAFIDQFVKSRSVLDIGCVDHVRSRAHRHRRIAQLASWALGIDILPEEIEALRQDGYNVACVDATSDVNLGRRFERIIAAEVIEHVDNPVALVRFGARHLSQSGQMLITTPNPFFFRWFLETVRHGTCAPNAEHVRWVIPAMALEIGERAGLPLAAYWLLQSRVRPGRRWTRHLRDLAGLAESELFSMNFLYLYAPYAHP